MRTGRRAAPSGGFPERRARLFIVTDARLRRLELGAGHRREPFLHLEALRLVPVGEIGQDLWESVYLIQKGGNYGWSVQEGDHPFRPERKRGPTAILKPIIDHSHTEFRSITGGFIYHGKKHPELRGAYIYGDFDTGRVWMLRYDAKTKKVTEHKELAKSRLRIVAWGQDADGEVYALNFIDGGLYQLAAAPPPAAARRR